MDKPKIFKRSDIKKDGADKRVKIIIHNVVYDVTDFLNEHPGGEEVLLEQAGEDASEAFEDVGHSTDARTMMNKYKIGEIDMVDRRETEEKIMNDWSQKKDDEHGCDIPFADFSIEEQTIEPPSRYRSWKPWMIPITLAVLATIIYRIYFHYHH